MMKTKKHTRKQRTWTLVRSGFNSETHTHTHARVIKLILCAMNVLNTLYI